MGKNLVFTDDEINIVTNADFLIQKRLISEKIVSYLSVLSNDIEQLLLQFKSGLPEEVITYKPKISRGENYEHLPYIILDYPRVFTPEHVFAFRTLFHWANNFSCTVQLSGKYLQAFRSSINAFLLSGNNFYVGINDDEWQHHFRPDNYCNVNKVIADEKLLKQVLTNQHYFKAAVKFTLKDSEKVNNGAINFYKHFLNHYCN